MRAILIVAFFVLCRPVGWSEPTTYVCGQVANGKTRVACYWVNGIRNDFPTRANAQGPGVATSICVTKGQVFAAGFYDLGKELANIACYWADGHRTDLSGGGPTKDSPTGGTAHSIFVFDGKVYVAGNCTDSPFTSYDSPCYWIDGVKTVLPGDDANSIYVAAGKVYVAGSAHGHICYWIDGIENELRLPDVARHSTESSIFVSNNKVYVAGSYEIDGNSVPCYWINGARVDLLKEGERNGTASKANAIFVSDGNVYVAGECNTWRDTFVACFWVNGKRTDLALPPDVVGTGNSIFICRNSIYVAGNYWSDLGDGSPITACYWLDGVRNDLHPKGQTSATGIFVTQ